MNFVTLLVAAAMISALLCLPMAALVMLALGNFGFTQFGLIDCIPVGIILSALAPSSSNR